MMLLLKNRTALAVAIFSVVLLVAVSECKRGGGRGGRGTYRGSNVFGSRKHGSAYDLGRRKSHGSDPQQPIPNPDVPKAAPAAATPVKTKSTSADASSGLIQQEKKQSGAALQSQPQPSAPASPQGTAGQGTAVQSGQRPIGWDVGQKSDGTINKNTASNLGSSPQGNPPPYSASHPGGNPPPYGAGHPAGNPPPYSQHPVGQAPPPYSANPNYGHQSYPNQPPPPYTPNGGYGAGAYGAGGYGAGGYGGGMGGYGGGTGGYGGNQGGFGGYGGGFGGYGRGFGGGVGSYAPYSHGMGGYGKKYGGGFGSGFAKTAFRSAIAGLLVWSLVSSFTHRPYYVYNYYNNPEKVPEDIPLPANNIVLCPENVTTLCAPNTAPLCTSNSTILCVVLAQQTVPCGDNVSLNCVKSLSACSDEEPCDEKEKQASAVNIPCVTNATIQGRLDSSISSISADSDTTNLCVTLLALPQPEEEAKQDELCRTTAKCPNVENPNVQTVQNSTEQNTSLQNATTVLSPTSTVEPLAM